MIETFRKKLLQRLGEIETETTNSAAARKTVNLDQQSVGRLSRMDALQHQAMANATNQRRNVEIQRIRAAIKRLDQDDFGYCIDCFEAIDPKRLSLHPTVVKCIDCAKS